MNWRRRKTIEAPAEPPQPAQQGGDVRVFVTGEIVIPTANARRIMQETQYMQVDLYTYADPDGDVHDGYVRGGHIVRTETFRIPLTWHGTQA